MPEQTKMERLDLLSAGHYPWYVPPDRIHCYPWGGPCKDEAVEYVRADLYETLRREHDLMGRRAEGYSIALKTLEKKPDGEV